MSEPLDWTRFDPPEGCPDECRGEHREACFGCPYYDEEGNEI
jgi:hypothetical protein